MIKTRVTELLGIKYPILCGPMAVLSDARLVSAVSNAGGLGILNPSAVPLKTRTLPTFEESREEVRRTRSMTDKPFAISLNVLSAGIRGESIDRFVRELNMAIEEGVDVIETVGRVPEALITIITDAKKDGKVKWIHRCARVRDAITAERIGVQAVSIIDYEAGGRIGMEDVTTMVRLPATVDAVKIPVIAAGGIGDARSFVAALALGAEGVLMATRFMCVKECMLHPNAKKLMIDTPENGCVFLLETPTRRERVIDTEYPKRINKMEAEGATPSDLDAFIGPVKGNNLAFFDGDINGGPMHVGQIVGLIHDEPTCAELIERIISEAEAIGQRLQKMGAFK